MRTIRKALRNFFRPYWIRMTRSVYSDAFRLGFDTGHKQAYRDILATLTEKQIAVNEIRSSAKSKTTKTGADGLKIGYDLALNALRDEIKTLRYMDLVRPTADRQKDMEVPF